MNMTESMHDATSFDRDETDAGAWYVGGVAGGHHIPAKAVADYVRAHCGEMHFQLGITPPQREAP